MPGSEDLAVSIVVGAATMVVTGWLAYQKKEDARRAVNQTTSVVTPVPASLSEVEMKEMQPGKLGKPKRK